MQKQKRKKHKNNLKMQKVKTKKIAGSCEEF